MTPTEVLQEIQKLPLTDQRQILIELTERLEQSTQTIQDPKEQEFIASLRRKGLVTEVPTRLPDDDSRTQFRRIDIKGKPISETIIEERG
jgi:hypothetical protein